MLITLGLKNPPHLDKLRAQPGRDALGLQPSGHHGSNIRPEGADPLTRLIALLNGLVVLLVDRAVLRVEPFYSLEQLVSLPAQPGNRLGILICPPLQRRGPVLGFQLEIPLHL